MKSILQVLLICTFVVLNGADKSRGKTRWPGIHLGEAHLISDVISKPAFVVDDLIEENLFRGLAVPTDGSGGEPVEEFDRFDLKTANSTTNSSYHFRSHVKDGIRGGQLHREETRRGHSVTGSYSYSDGFVLRTVEYAADENGYRIVKETLRRIGNGPKENRAGVANVLTETHGRRNRYTVRGADVVGR